MRLRLAVALVALGLAAAAGCDRDGGTAASSPAPPGPATAVAAAEGRLDLLAPAGYVERGRNDPAADWVTPFERGTGCRVSVRRAGSGERAAEVLEAAPGRFDALLTSADVTGRLIAEGAVAELNAELVPAVGDFLEPLRQPAATTLAGRTYGIAHTWRPHVLAYDADVVVPPPTSWEPVFDGASHPGAVTARRTPMAVADAALVLGATRPELGIDDPYELTHEQLDAAVDLLAAQAAQVGAYWDTTAAAVRLWRAGDAVIGAAWPVQVAALRDAGRAVGSVVPEEGVTAVVDVWMMAARAPHPGCAYRWLAYAATPPVQAEVAARVGAAPANERACDLLGEAVCDRYGMSDPEVVARIAFWKTPVADCGRPAPCTDLAEWARRWAAAVE